MDGRDVVIFSLLALSVVLAWLWQRAVEVGRTRAAELESAVAEMKRKPPCVISEADCNDGQYAEPVIWTGNDREGNGRITVGDKRTNRPLAFVGHTSTQWHMLIDQANGTAKIMCMLEGIPVEQRNGSYAHSLS